MANVYAVKSGNWSDTTVWNTGALPTSADDVWSNGFSVAVNVSPTVLSIRNGATTGIVAGGQFTISADNLTINCTGAGIANGSAAATLAISVLTNQTTIINSALNGSSSGIALSHSGQGVVTVTGAINPNGSRNTSTGTLNLIGNCSSTNVGPATRNESSGIVNITGNIDGGSGNSRITVENVANGIVSVTGTITAGSSGPGLQNSSTGTVSITGDLYGHPTGGNVAIINNSSGTINHVGAAYGRATAAIGTGSGAQITILTGPLVSSSIADGSAAASGVNPCIALRWFPADTALSTFTYTMRGATLSGSPSIRPPRVLALPEATSAAYPAANNVRTGTVYGVGNAFTGTCAVPPAGSVAFGVPVDNTTGTAAIDGPSIRAAIGLATANLDTQLDALPTAAENATAAWAAASRTITGGTVDTLTNAPTVPTPAEIADAVRTELTPELARVSNCATVETTGDQLAALQ